MPRQVAAHRQLTQTHLGFLYRFFGFGEPRKSYIYPLRIRYMNPLICFDEAHAYDEIAFINFEQLVRTLYEEVSFAAGAAPDWEFARTLFIDEAVIILRYGPDNMTVFDVPGWVDDFIAFTEEEEVKKSGFTETILGMNTYMYGDIASINVLFESHIPGTDRKNQGVDIFQLIRKGDTSDNPE